MKQNKGILPWWIHSAFHVEDDAVPVELINRYVRLLEATINITSGLGTLALLWSTVVLLGGFVSILRIEEFWILTMLSFLMASRVVDNYDNEFKRGIYWEEANIFTYVGRQKWMQPDIARAQRIMLGVVLLPKYILFLCFAGLSYKAMPFVTFGISVWRLVQQDYGDAGGDTANSAKLNVALNIFYVLVLLQGLFFLYWVRLKKTLGLVVFQVCLWMSRQCGHEKWSSKLVDMYCSETRRKLKKNGELPADSWNLVKYGLELLQSASGDDDHRWGARVLDKLFVMVDKHKIVRQELRLSIQNLIDMIGRIGAADDDIENRERAARIVAHLATDLHITCFPGTLQCICSLLESCCKQQVNSPWENPEEQSLVANNYDMVVPTTTDQTRASNGKRTTFLQWCNRSRQQMREFKQEVRQYSETEYRRLYKPMGAKDLISQGLLILEGLTQDEGNCVEIIKDERLLSKIKAPLTSHDILSKLRNNTMDQILNKTFTVLSRLLTSPGGGSARLRKELASNTEAVSNLLGILETNNDREGAQKLHGESLNILAQLIFDDSFKELDFDKFFKALLLMFLVKEANNTTVQDPSNATAQVEQEEKATRVRGRAAEALAKLLPHGTARCTLSKQMTINILTTVLNDILSNGSNSHVLEITIVEEGDTGSVQAPALGNEKQSEERKFMTAMLSLAVVIYNENVISEEDFAYCATPEDDAAVVKKLKEIIEVNKNSTPECLRIVKLICQLVITMIKVKPSCIQNFNGHSFKEALAEALEAMSEVDDCMLFAANDREVVKPARSLASLVSEVQEVLQTA